MQLNDPVGKQEVAYFFSSERQNRYREISVLNLKFLCAPRRPKEGHQIRDGLVCLIHWRDVMESTNKFQCSRKCCFVENSRRETKKRN